MSPPPAPGPRWADAWQESWDRQQEAYAPGREARLTAMIDVTEAVLGPEPVVVDLGCGPGSVARRLLARLPGARAVAVDHDPVLLALARATFAGDPRVQVVDADISITGWERALDGEHPAAVLVTTVTHYFDEPALRRLYGAVARILGPGGLLANADHMPLGGLPTVAAALAARAQTSREQAWGAGVADWSAWWVAVERDPALADACRARDRRPAVSRSAEWHPPASWHRRALLEAGFREAGTTHRWADGALIVARR